MTPDPRFLELVEQYREGSCSEDAFAELEKRLEASAEERAYFRRYMNLDAGIRELCELEEKMVSMPAATTTPKAWALLTLAALLLLGSAWLYAKSRQAPLEPSPLVQTAPKPEPVNKNEKHQISEFAVISQMTRVEWKGEAFSPGVALQNERLVFDKGLVHVDFISGASVVLEGPVDFEILGQNKGFCHFGKLLASVPPQARGFEVLSNEMNVVDLGTEFGMTVDAEGEGEVHVLNGKVQVFEKNKETPWSLFTGDGIRLLPSGRFIQTVSDAMAFIGFEKLTKLLRDERSEAADRWKAHKESLADDPRVAMFYHFDEQNAWDRFVKNSISDSGAAPDAALVGCQWAEGRWPGKGAIEFKQNTDRLRVSLPGQFDSLTLSTWVRIDGFDRDLSSLLLTDGWSQGAVHWQIHKAGGMIFGVHSDSSGISYDSPSLFSPNDLGRWVHLSVVYDYMGRQVTHYMNGDSVAVLPIEEHAPMRLSAAEIGNWTPLEIQAQTVRNLNGRMDVFYVFSEALSPLEIRNIYLQGRP